MFEVKVLKSVAKLPTGKYEILYHKPEFIPNFLIMESRNDNFYLSVDNFMSSGDTRFPKDSECIITDLSHKGQIGKIKSYSEQTPEIKLEFNSKSNFPRINFNKLYKICVESMNYDFNKRYNLKEIARTLKLPISVISKMTSSILVKLESKLPNLAGEVIGKNKKIEEKRNNRERDNPNVKVFDLGMKLKNHAKKLHIPFFVVFDYESNDWLFHEYVIDILVSFKNKFEYICNYLKEQMKPSENSRTNKKPGGMIDARDLLPGKKEEEILSTIRGVITWTQRQPLSDLPYVPAGTQIISKEGAKEVTQLLEDAYKKPPGSPNSLEIDLSPAGVHVEHAPFWIGVQGEREGYAVGDRVVAVKTVGRGYVPFGSKGVIIGRSECRLLVLFDKPVLTGSSYNAHTLPNRAKLMDIDSLFNLSLYYIYIYIYLYIEDLDRKYHYTVTRIWVMLIYLNKILESIWGELTGDIGGIEEDIGESEGDIEIGDIEVIETEDIIEEEAIEIEDMFVVHGACNQDLETMEVVMEVGMEGGMEGMKGMEEEVEDKDRQTPTNGENTNTITNTHRGGITTLTLTRGRYNLGTEFRSVIRI